MAILIAAAFPLMAQQRPAPALPPPAGPGTIVGIVIDTLGRPIDSVLVYHSMPRRDTYTDANGRFRLNGLQGFSDKDIQIGFRKIGYMPQGARVIHIEKGGTSILIEMVPIVRTLATVLTEATRTGLYGLVTDGSGTPLEGAEVWLMGSGAGKAKSDSLGQFFIDGKIGHYMTKVSKTGYLTQMVSVTLGEKVGRKIVVSMSKGTSGSLARQAAIVDELHWRLVSRRPMYSKLYTREDIDRLNPRDVRQLATMPGWGRVDESCEVTVDGYEKVPIFALDLETIEFMELYEKGKARSATTSINGNARVGTQQASRTSFAPGPCPSMMFAWTRK